MAMCDICGNPHATEKPKSMTIHEHDGKKKKVSVEVCSDRCESRAEQMAKNGLNPKTGK